MKQAIGAGRITNLSEKKGFTRRKKETEVNHLEEDEEQLPSPPISLKKTYQCLLNIGQVAPILALAMQPPFPH
jgi:hypothetical protein